MSALVRADAGDLDEFAAAVFELLRVLRIVVAISHEAWNPIGGFSDDTADGKLSIAS